MFAAAFNTNPVPGADDRWIKVFATRPIKPGEELLMSYGEGYWDRHARPPGRPLQQFHQQLIQSEGAESQGSMIASGPTLDLLTEVNAQLPDACAYVGHEAYAQVLSSDAFYCEAATGSYITTAVLRRSGRHPEAPTTPTAKGQHSHRQYHLARNQ